MSLPAALRCLLAFAVLACGGTAHAQTYTLAVMTAGDGVGTVTATGINCPADCAEGVASGTTITLTAAADTTTTPPSGFTSFSLSAHGWSGCDTAIGNQCTVTVTSNRTVTATFGRSYSRNIALEGWQMVPYVGTGATGTAMVSFLTTTREMMWQGQITGATGTPTEVCVHWGASRGANAAASPYCYAYNIGFNVATLPPEAIAPLTSGQGYVTVRTSGFPAGEVRGQLDALGVVTRHNLSVAKIGQGTVTATTEAGAVINCGSTCAASIPAGKVATLTAAPVGGGTFAGWSGACSGTGTCQVTMDAPKSVTAAFGGADLGVTVSPSKTTAAFGEDVTFAIIVTNAGPDAATGAQVQVTAGGTIVSVPSGCTSVLNNVTCTLGDIAAGAAPSIAMVLRPAGFSLRATATASASSPPDPVPGNNTANAFVDVYQPARLINISTRMRVLTGDDVLIGGFVIGGTSSKNVVIRARGPSLAQAGVTGVLANPQLQLFSGPTVIASNDDWQQAANATDIQGVGFAPPLPEESAILINLAPGAYTAIVSGVAGSTGVGLVEVFELDSFLAPLVNIATRGRVQTGDDVMIAGFALQGNAQHTVVVRARGPSLTQAGVSGVLANPRLQLLSGGTVLASNDDWQQAANAAAIEAAGLAPLHPDESAIMITLSMGLYTAVVRGVGDTSGVAIIEVFKQ